MLGDLFVLYLFIYLLVDVEHAPLTFFLENT